MDSAKIFLLQVRSLTGANLKARYRKTFAGFIWVTLNPIVMYLAQALVFSELLKLQLQDYGYYLFSGLVPWIFVSQTLEMTVGLFVNHGLMIKAFPVNPLVYLVSQLADNLINFVMWLILGVVVFSFSSNLVHWEIVLLPIPVGLMALGVFGFSWLGATLQVFLRDTRFLLSFVLGFGYYLTPIFYPIEALPHYFKFIVLMNPVYHLIRPIRVLIYNYSLAEFYSACVWSVTVVIFTNSLAYLFWKWKRNEVYFYV